MPDQEIAPEDKPLDDIQHAEERQQVEDTENLSSPEDGPQPGEDPDATVVVYATEDEARTMGFLDPDRGKKGVEPDRGKKVVEPGGPRGEDRRGSDEDRGRRG